METGAVGGEQGIGCFDPGLRGALDCFGRYAGKSSAEATLYLRELNIAVRTF